MTRRKSGFAFAVLVACLGVLSACAQMDESSIGCAEVANYREEGVASWYGSSHQGKKTASGQPFDMNAPTAAHRRLPFGTQVKVTNLENGRATNLMINDRGPYRKGRMLDVSQKGARDLGFFSDGTARVRLETLTAKTDC